MKFHVLRVSIAAFMLTIIPSYAFPQNLPITFPKPLAEQESKEKEIIKALQVGDRVPDIEFKNILNYPEKTLRLSDFKGKLVLLDFWSTSCIPCIKNFPKLDSLQKEFKDRLQIILITKENQDKVLNFFETPGISNFRKYQFPSVLGDKIVSEYFPYRSIPHYAWVSDDGMVRAITSSEYVTSANIKGVLESEDLQLPVKKDIDVEKPLFLSDEFSLNDFTQYSIFLKGKMEYFGKGNRPRRTGEIIRGRAIFNYSLLDMYKEVAENLIPNFNDKKVVLNVSDSSKLIFDISTKDRLQWEKENLYTYELIVPLDKANGLYSYMLENLNNYSGYYGEVKKISTPCLLLTRIGQDDKLRTNGDKPMSRTTDQKSVSLKNAPIHHLVVWLNRLKTITNFVIDETNYIGKIDLQLSINSSDLNSIKKELQRHGLDLVKTEREMEVFILTEKSRIVQEQNKP